MRKIYTFGMICFLLLSVSSISHALDDWEKSRRALLSRSGITVDSVQPGTGVLGQNLDITVTGSGFDADTRVFLIPDTGNRSKHIAYADTEGYAWGVAVSGNYAYVADGEKGLKILDVSNPSAPLPVKTVPTPGTAYSVAVSGSIACVADGEGGLQIINVGNPATAAIIANIDSFVKDVALVGNTAFIAGSSFRIISLADPYNPQSSGMLELKGERLRILDNRAYMTDGSGLKIIDTSILSAPKLLGSLDTPGFASGIDVVNDTAYVTDNDNRSDQLGSLRIIDVSAPATPRLISSLSLNRPSDVRISGTTAYIADFPNGLSMIDISNPADPVVTACINTPRESEKLSVSGNMAFIADGNGGLRILDIANPRRTVIGSLNTQTQLTWGGDTEDRILYMADPYIRDLSVIDVKDPSLPTLMNNPATNSALYLPLDVAVSGTMAYMLTGESLGYGNFHVIDLSTSPKIKFLNLSYMLDIESDTSGGIAVSGDRVFAVNADGDIHLIDVSDPYRPSFTGLIETPGDTVGVYAVGDTLYTTNRDSGMQILDMNNPSLPRGTFAIPAPYTAFGLCVKENTAFIAGVPGAVLMVDVADPADMQLTGILDTFHHPWNVDVDGEGDKLYVSEDENLLILPAPVEAQVSVSSSASLTATIPSPQTDGYYNVFLSNRNGSAERVGAVFYTVPNDDFMNAYELTEAQPKLTSSNLNATREINEPEHANKTVRKSLWYKIVPDTAGTVFVDTEGSEFDTLLAVYTGTGLSSLNKIADNDDYRDHSSYLSFNVQAGEIYHIAVDGYRGSCGKMVLNWRETPLSPPANDEFANASIIKIPDGQTVSYNSNAEKESGEPSHAGKAGGRSVWWEWTPDKAGTVSINTHGSDFDTVLAIYSGTDLNDLTLLAANDNDSASLNSRITANVRTGESYFIAVDGSSISESGQIVLNWDEDIIPAPGNDDFLNAEEFSADEPNGNSGSSDGTNVNATREAGEPDHIYKSGGNSVWWKWTATQNGELFLDTEGSNFDTVLTVYTGQNLFSLQKTAENDDAPDITDENANYSGLSFEVRAGESYYIAVTGFDNSEGNIVLNWEQKGLTLKSVYPLTSDADTDFSGVILTGIGFDDSTSVLLADGNGHSYNATINEITPVRMEVSFTAPFVAGHYDLTVSNGEESSTINNAVVFVPSADAGLLKNKAIIVAGDGPGPNIWEEIRWGADTAYNALIRQGYAPEDIWYFRPDTASEGRDNDPTLQNLENLFDYLVTNPPYSLIVYYVGHGEDGAFWLNKEEKITATDTDTNTGTDTWLDNLQQVMIGDVIFIYDACNSGTFVQDSDGTPVLSAPENKNRIVISSSLPEETAVFADYGSLSFSNYFWSAVGNGKTVDWAFRFSAKKLEDYQTPMIDSNGNSISGESEDHLIASVNLGMGNYDPNVPRPSIEWVTADQLPAIQAKVSDTQGGGVSKVWAVIIPPDHDIDSEPVIVALSDADMDGIYEDLEDLYIDISTPGTYAVIIHAVNVQGNNAVPKPAQILFTQPGTSDDYKDAYEPDDNESEATPVLPNAPSLHHNFHAPGDEDWMVFYAYAGTTYKLLAANPGLICQPLITIYADTAIVTPQGIPGEDVSLYWNCEANGKYYIKVTNANGNFGKTVRYDFSVSVSEGPPTFDLQIILSDAYLGIPIEDATIESTELGISCWPGAVAEENRCPYTNGGVYGFSKTGNEITKFSLIISVPGKYIMHTSTHELENTNIVYITDIKLMPTVLSDNMPVNLPTAIFILKMMSGIMPESLTGTGFPSNWDINNDTKIGVEEAIYILQRISGLR